MKGFNVEPGERTARVISTWPARRAPPPETSGGGLFNTNGELVDESYQRDLKTGFLSWYDETKFRAHEAAEECIPQHVGLQRDREAQHDAVERAHQNPKIPWSSGILSSRVS